MSRRTPQDRSSGPPDSRDKVDNTGSLLASSKGSLPWLWGGVAASMPPHSRHDVGDTASTAFDTMGREPQRMADNIVLLSSQSLVCGTGESQTQYTAESQTECKSKSWMQHTAKSATMSGLHMPCLRPGGHDRYFCLSGA